MAKDVDSSAETLDEVGRIGALDREVADALARVPLYRFVQLANRRDWVGGAQEVELAQSKLEYLEGIVSDPKEIAKIRGYCWAARGLVMLERRTNSDYVPRRDAGRFASHLRRVLLVPLSDAPLFPFRRLPVHRIARAKHCPDLRRRLLDQCLKKSVKLPDIAPIHTVLACDLVDPAIRESDESEPS